MRRLLVFLAVMLAAVATAPTALAAGECPAGGTKFDTASGSQVVNGVTITWSGTTISATGGTAQVCVKAGNDNSGIVTISDGQSYTVNFGANPAGEFPNISHVVVYSATTTPPPPGPQPPGPQPPGPQPPGPQPPGPQPPTPQPPGGGAGGTPPSPLAPPPPPAAGGGGAGGLPFTGLPVWIPMLMGAGLLGSGLLLLRRRRDAES